MIDLSIAPASGLGPIPFGATRELVHRQLGDPSRVIEQPDEPGREIWVYPDIQVAASFNPSGVLDTFEISNPAATLHGRPIIGVAVEVAAQFLRQQFAFPIDAMMLDEETVEQLRIRDLGFGLWIEEGVVASVSWSDATGAEDQSVPGAAPN